MDDLISRQAAIDEIKALYEWHEVVTEDRAIDHFKRLPSAEPERKKPDHGYMWICPECGLEVHSDFSRCVRCGWDRPGAEPERKKGFWIIEDEFLGDCIDRCSMCGWMYSYNGFDDEREDYNFCPNCGADMRGEEHEDD